MYYTNEQIIRSIKRKVLSVNPLFSETGRNDASVVFGMLNELDIEGVVKGVENEFNCRFDNTWYISTSSFDRFCRKVCSYINPEQTSATQNVPVFTVNLAQSIQAKKGLER